ncbi:MAG: hypothetical protein ABI670_03945 [Chloroflexota bacterium]
MNLKLKRVVRTPQSEEIAIFDNDTRDERDAAISIGKLEVHYLPDQIVGTLLIWKEYADDFNRTHAPGSKVTMDDLVEEVLSEVVEPLGVSGEYGIEIYYPSIMNHSFASNYSDEDEDGLDEADSEEYEEESEKYETEETGESEEEQPQDDDYYRKLTNSR